MPLISNARMYAVSPAAEAAWRTLLEHVGEEAGVELAYLPYPAPRPMEDLWRRPDLGCAFMCGYPIALRLADVVALAAPIPDASWADGRALYRSDFIVRADSRYGRLEDTFGGTIGWTADHSHSGFNAPRHHLLGLRTANRARLYDRDLGPLLTPRAVIDAVLDRRIDVGPLDSYWHLLIERHAPEFVAGIRVVASTGLAPLPALVAAQGTPDDTVAALRAALVAAAARPWFAALGEQLRLRGFAPVAQDGFATTLRWRDEAEAAGYRVPG